MSGSTQKKILEDAVARMRAKAGDQTPDPVEPPTVGLELDPKKIASEYERLTVEAPGEASEMTGKIKLSQVERRSLVRIARRGTWVPDDPVLHASCQLLCSYGYATKHPVVGSQEYRITPAGRAAAKQSKLSMRLGGK